MIVNDPVSFISELFEKEGEVWTGKLYKVGEGNYYHTSQEGAEFYESEDKGVNEYDMLPFNRAIFIDLDEINHMNFLEGLDPNLEDSGDIALFIESALPHIKDLGFDGAVIFGETGAEVEGLPVEVVDL
jgi:hypothetical protein